MYDLLEVLKNPMKLQLNRLNRYNFQLKLFHTAVTMKLVKVIENGMNR